MKQVDKISAKELQEMADAMFGSFVKAVVDIEKDILAVDAEMHYDIKQMLLENGSKQYDLWGINLYPAGFGKDTFIEYDSMINIRSTQGNMSRGVEDAKVRTKIEEIVQKVVHE